MINHLIYWLITWLNTWRDFSMNSSITLIYWEDLNSSSLLDVKSYICLREKLRAHENNQNAFSTIDQSHALNDCDCTSILTIYSTSTWHKSNQEKKKVIQYNHTLSFHHARLSFIMLEISIERVIWMSFN